MDLRQAIFDDIAAIVPCDGLEKAQRENVLRWIEDGFELCRTAKPATPPKHLVSYFVVVDDDHVLLVDHINAQLWLPTGGHVEPGEHPKTTVEREMREELGVAPVFVHDNPLMVTETETVGLTAGHTDVSLWYAVKGDRTKPVSFDKAEFHSVRWFRMDEVPLGKSDPYMQRFLNKLRSMGGNPRE